MHFCQKTLKVWAFPLGDKLYRPIIEVANPPPYTEGTRLSCDKVAEHHHLDPPRYDDVKFFHVHPEGFEPPTLPV